MPKNDGKRDDKDDTKQPAAEARRLGITLLAVWAPIQDRRRRIMDRGEHWTQLDAFVGAFYSGWFRDNPGYWQSVERSSAIAIK